MKNKGTFICIIMLLLTGKMVGQSHIYERYAMYDNLEVAYMENVTTDSVNIFNCTIIIAKDSTTWQWLKDTFHIAPKHMMLCIRDAQNPENDKTGDTEERCVLIANTYRTTIIICEYTTIEQLRSIIKFSIDQPTHEKAKTDKQHLSSLSSADTGCSELHKRRD